MDILHHNFMHTSIKLQGYKYKNTQEEMFHQQARKNMDLLYHDSIHTSVFFRSARADSSFRWK
mgnify:CR=1 FL=1